MDVNIGGNGSFDVSRFGGLEGGNGSLEVLKFGSLEGGAQTSKLPNLQTSKHLTIQTSVAAPEDIAAAGIPDAALSRDDDVGRLVAQAFDLPPPPMPTFAVDDRI